MYLPDQYRWIADNFEPEGDPWHLYEIARELEAAGHLDGAATAYDRAYGLDPAAAEIATARARLLDRLAVTEHGLTFRYIPGGAFLMGRDDGDPDEGPRHPVWLSPFWLTETPISWADYCRLRGWSPPMEGGFPPDDAIPTPSHRQARFEESFLLLEANKIRDHYCGDPPTEWASGAGPPEGQRFDTKPMVALHWGDAMDLAARLSSARVRYTLPTEAQWEKAARGALLGTRYPWGNQPPTPERCDCNNFHAFALRPVRDLPPNGYGLYGMSGGVWEWCRDWYDRDYFRASPPVDPEGPAEGQEKVLRGGSWADCAEAVTVTFRMGLPYHPGRRPHLHEQTPNFGARFCRMVGDKKKG
jgi:formylglycine-generating enzyme required for sulfatase activity